MEPFSLFQVRSLSTGERGRNLPFHLPGCASPLRVGPEVAGPLRFIENCMVLPSCHFLDTEKKSFILF